MRGKDVSATDAKTKAGITPAYAGKRRKRPTGKRLEGITPAYAGKSWGSRNGYQLIEDHPRLCGEKSYGPSLDKSKIRITPAYAGKSGVLSGVLYAFEDHPRLCGEKLGIFGVKF